MGLEGLEALLFAELLAERPFVDDGVVGRAVLLEDGGRDEGLEDEPAAEVDAADLVSAPREGYAAV